MSIAAQIIRERAVVFALWLTQKNGRKAYFVVEVKPSLKEEFLAKVDAKGNLHLPDYGTVHYAGWQEPDEAQKAVFREKYGLYE